MANPKKGVPPTEWKLVIIKWLGLYPCLVAISYLGKWLGLEPLWFKLMVESMLIVPLLAYLVTPMMDDIFSTWLYQGKDTHPDDRHSTDIGS